MILRVRFRAPDVATVLSKDRGVKGGDSDEPIGCAPALGRSAKIGLSLLSLRPRERNLGNGYVTFFINFDHDQPFVRRLSADRDPVIAVREMIKQRPDFLVGQRIIHTVHRALEIHGLEGGHHLPIKRSGESNDFLSERCHLN